MRTLITMLVFMVAMSVSAQVVVLRAQYAEVTTTGEWDDAEYADITEENITIVWDIDKASVEFANKNETYISILSMDSKETVMKGEYEQVQCFFDAIDDKGESVMLLIRWWMDDGYGWADGAYSYSVRLIYDDIWFGYYCTVLSIRGL